MRFSLSRYLRLVGRGAARANAPSRRTRTWAGGSSPEGLEDRKLLSLASVAVAEGNVNQANFHVRLPFAPGFPFAAQYQTFDESASSAQTTKQDPITGTTVTIPPEYTATSGTFTYDPTAKDHVIPVPVTPDKDFEYHERFGLKVDVPGRTRYGIATVLNHHGRVPHPQVSNPKLLEVGNGPLTAVFNVSLPFAPKSPITYSYQTFDEAASSKPKMTTDKTTGQTVTHPAEYTPASGTFTLGPGKTSTQIPVTVTPDQDFEYRENFALQVYGPGRLAYGIATIINIHPRNPIPKVSNPVVIEKAGT